MTVGAPATIHSPYDQRVACQEQPSPWLQESHARPDRSKRAADSGGDGSAAGCTKSAVETLVINNCLLFGRGMCTWNKGLFLVMHSLGDSIAEGSLWSVKSCVGGSSCLVATGNATHMRFSLETMYLFMVQQFDPYLLADVYAMISVDWFVNKSEPFCSEIQIAGGLQLRAKLFRETDKGSNLQPH